MEPDEMFVIVSYLFVIFMIVLGISLGYMGAGQ